MFSSKLKNEFKAGAAAVTIIPSNSHFLFGYPFVERMSTGTNDELLSSAIYLNNGENQVLFISNDIIYVSKDFVASVRRRINKKTAIPEANIMLAATHTHSGPVTTDIAISGNDPIIPEVDKEYLNFLEDQTVEAACQAFKNSEISEVSFVVGDATGVGTNRHNPDWPKDMDVPTMIVRNKNKEFICCMLVCSMHPTVLHEDSTLYSGDFPHFTRELLQKEILGDNCPVVYFTGTAGNQSPRHVTKENTFEEAKRIGELVSKSIISKLSEETPYLSEISISTAQELVDLPKRKFPSVESSHINRDKTKKLFESLKKTSNNSQEIRTAEVNWFGAEELLYLSKLAESNMLEKYYNLCLPAEVQIFKISEWSFVAWPGEVFVEYGLDLKNHFDNVSMITYANGDLQGYITTKEAYEKGFYEAGNSFFNYKAGELLMEKTINLLKGFDK